MASCEGRNPRIPQYEAGTLTLPPVSDPMKARSFWFKDEQRIIKIVLNQKKNIKIVHERKLPKAKSTSFAPTATADPLEDPPGTRSGTHGFLGVP